MRDIFLEEADEILTRSQDLLSQWKTDLNNKSGNNKITNQRKKKYLDTILTNNFTNNYFKKKELKIKNFKLDTIN